MDSHRSVADAPPESRVPINFPFDPSPQAVAIDSVVPPVTSVETRTSEFMVAGNAEEGAQENQWKRRPFRASARGWYGMRWGVGFQGKFQHHPFPAGTEPIHCHGSSDVQRVKSTIIESYEHQLVPKINQSTAGEEAMATEPPPLKTSLLPLSWCDICRVDCNSLIVLEKHRTGKRHKRTVQLLEKMKGRPDIIDDAATTINHLQPEHHSEYVAVPPIDDMNAANLKKKRKRSSAPDQRPRICVLCNASCNSQAMFESHVAGKKHTSRINLYQRPNTVYGLMTGYIPFNQSSALASSQDDQHPLYYGLVNYEQQKPPDLEQEYDFEEDLPLLDSEGQYGFIES